MFCVLDVMEFWSNFNDLYRRNNLRIPRSEKREEICSTRLSFTAIEISSPIRSGWTSQERRDENKKLVTRSLYAGIREDAASSPPRTRNSIEKFPLVSQRKIVFRTARPSQLPMDRSHPKREHFRSESFAKILVKIKACHFRRRSHDAGVNKVMVKWRCVVGIPRACYISQSSNG